jgi:hypothetical protein
VFAAGKTNAAEFRVNETTLKEAVGREEESEREKEGGTRSMARTWWHGCKLFC